MITENPFNTHVDLVRAVADAGVEPPEQWTALHARFTAFTETPGGAVDRLAAAIVDGDPADDLRIDALVEAVAAAQPQVAASVVNVVRTAVTDRLRTIYADAAVENYSAVAAKFNTLAAKLTAAVDIVDLEAEAAGMVTANSKARTAWSEAPGIAAELDALLPALAAAATLAGAPTAHGPLLTLPLVCDTTGHHRRRAWDAWAATGRTGRWSALITEGIVVRAHPNPVEVQPYRRPKPLEQRTVTTGGETRAVTVDPEDPDYEPAPRPFAYGGALYAG